MMLKTNGQDILLGAPHREVRFLREFLMKGSNYTDEMLRFNAAGHRGYVQN